MIRALLALGAAAWLVWLAAIGLALAAPAPTGPAMMIRTDDGGHGSGAYIGNGLVLTAGHVVSSDDSPDVILPGGTVLTGRVAIYDIRHDIALVEVVTLGEIEQYRRELACRDPLVGEDVVLVGYPYDLYLISTFGRVSGGYQPDDPSNPTARWTTAFVVDAPALPGNSGGPVYDADGRVLGVLVGGLTKSALGMSVPLPGYSFVVPATIACQYLSIT